MCSSNFLEDLTEIVVEHAFVGTLAFSPARSIPTISGAIAVVVALSRAVVVTRWSGRTVGAGAGDGAGPGAGAGPVGSVTGCSMSRYNQNALAMLVRRTSHNLPTI